VPSVAGGPAEIPSSKDTNITNNINIIQMSTQDLISLQSGCTNTGGPGSIGAVSSSSESGMDLEKLVQMMMMLMMLKMMQDMMQQMSGQGAGGMIGG